MVSPNHEKFLSHLDASKEAVFRVADWLMSSGLSVRLAGVQRAPERDQWKEFADSGDIFIEKRIEVKRLSRDFSSEADWPFGRAFIVCAKHAWDRAQPKPEAFIIVSSNMQHCAIVRGRTRMHWVVERRKDSRYDGVEQEFFLCPMEHVEWLPLDRRQPPQTPQEGATN